MSNADVWREGHSHHAVVCEVHQGEEGEEEVPEELCDSPFEAYHCVHDEAINYSLTYKVWKLNRRLPIRKLRCYFVMNLINKTNHRAI